MEQTKKFTIDIVWSLFGLISTIVITFLLRVILARWLGPSSFGLFTMVFIIQGLASLVATLGIPIALTKYSAEYKDNTNKLHQVFSCALICSISLGLVTAILLYALSDLLAAIFDMPGLASLLKFFVLALPFIAFVETLLGLFNGLREMKVYAYILIVRSSLLILLSLALVALGFGVEGAVFGIVLSAVTCSILGIIFSSKYLYLTFDLLLDNAKKLVLFGSQLFSANAVNLLANQAGILLLGYFLTDTEVGFYSVAVSISMVLTVIPFAIQKITYPATSEYWATDNHQVMQKMIDRVMKYAACVLLPLGLGLGFFAKEIISILFGAEYIKAALPLCILLIARVIQGATVIPIGASFSGIGRPDIGLKIGTLSCVLSIVLNILLIPRFGIAGAAMGTTISLLAGASIFLILLPRIVNIEIDTRWHAQITGFACIAIAFFLIGAEFIGSKIAGSVILCGYVIFVYTFLLTKEDKNRFKSLAYPVITRR